MNQNLHLKMLKTFFLNNCFFNKKRTYYCCFFLRFFSNDLRQIMLCITAQSEKVAIENTTYISYD